MSAVSPWMPTISLDNLRIRERVAAGAEWLDSTRPGWVNDVNLDRLDLRQCEDCVLGQIVKKEDSGLIGYDSLVAKMHVGTTRLPLQEIEECLTLRREAVREIDDLESLVMTSDEAMERGFHLAFRAVSYTDEWRQLTDEWRRVIEARRGSR